MRSDTAADGRGKRLGGTVTNNLKHINANALRRVAEVRPDDTPEQTR